MTEEQQQKSDNLAETAPKPVLTILYQDEHIVAVVKPAGLFVHRSFMDKNEIYFVVQLLRDQIGQYVYPVHRLDRPTSGVLLFALTKRVAHKLSEAFANKSYQAQSIDRAITRSSEMLQMKKTYYALVRGHLAIKDPQGNYCQHGLIDYALKEKLDRLGDKDVSPDKPAQSAQTHYQVIHRATLPIALGKYDTVRYSLVKLQPITGRRHQIRRHLAHLRYPIIGDINYGDNKHNPFFIEHFGFKRLMLHAQSLEFIHPVTEKLTIITADFDNQWQHVFTKLNFKHSLCAQRAVY